MSLQKSKIIYWFIDDTQNTAQGIIEAINSSCAENIEVTYQAIASWEDITKRLLDSTSNFDGLILDWKLSDDANSAGTRASYDAETLAQQCRRLVVEGINSRKLEKDFPIILCSSKTNFKTIFVYDNSAADLFDKIYDKTSIYRETSSLISLAEGYQLLNKKPTLADILKQADDQINEAFRYNFNKIKDKASHEIARFFLREVIERKGVLINEATLAARLGIDMQASTAWNDLKKQLADKCEYKGIFCALEPRWWAQALENWWNSNISTTDELPYTEAEKRVQLLKQKLGIEKLVAAKRPKNGTSTEFWAACLGSNVPIAEIDGFLLDVPTNYSWQEPEYLCFEEAKNETNKIKKWAMFPLYPREIARLQSET